MMTPAPPLGRRDGEQPPSDRDRIDEPPDGDGYVETMNRLIDQAVDYMGRDRAVETANSVPIEVDESGEIQELQFGETEESMRAVTELVMEAYSQALGRQLVLNMLQESASGQQLRTLEDLCPSDGGSTDRARAE